MDELLSQFLGVPEKQVRRWMVPGKYLSGSELVAAGVAELIDLAPPNRLGAVAPPAHRSPRRRTKVASQ